jgi:hypothetical protein
MVEQSIRTILRGIVLFGVFAIGTLYGLYRAEKVWLPTYLDCVEASDQTYLFDDDRFRAH